MHASEGVRTKDPLSTRTRVRAGLPLTGGDAGSSPQANVETPPRPLLGQRRSELQSTEVQRPESNNRGRSQHYLKTEVVDVADR
jgi:hypothetical protein